MKLSTPFGEIAVLIDDVEIEYSFKELKPFSSCPDVNGRYIIEIDFEPDGEEHSISCMFSDYVKDIEVDFESGENLECCSFFIHDVKMSIGVVGDDWYSPYTGKRESKFDFDVDYLENGMAYHILPFTKTAKYLFGLSWIQPCNEQNDVQTWFGADPSYYKAGYM